VFARFFQAMFLDVIVDFPRRFGERMIRHFGSNVGAHMLSISLSYMELDFASCRLAELARLHPHHGQLPLLLGLCLRPQSGFWHVVIGSGLAAFPLCAMVLLFLLYCVVDCPVTHPLRLCRLHEVAEFVQIDCLFCCCYCQRIAFPRTAVCPVVTPP
jgi:hypothetical protein